MNVEHSIPPLRDLPPGRLEQRAEHLRAEVGSRRTRTYALAAAAAIAILGVIVATPAFGLQGHIAHLFSSSNQRRPPELIQRYFRNLDVYPGGANGVIPSKARIAIEARVPSYGTKTIWVAPTRNGGFCSTTGCDRDRRMPFHTTLVISGPTSRNSQPMPHSSDVHVFLEGDTLIQGASRVAVQFEDLSWERTPLVWVSRPINAGFFLYELPKAHWKVGKRPIDFVVEDSHGKALAESSEAVGYFVQSQAYGLAPSGGSSHTLLWVLLAAAGGLLAGVLGTAFLRPGWARRA
jgi:hypothetical protein